LSKKILVVEDDRELQEYYEIMFEDMDCQIIRAYDGGEALEKLKEAVPDLIILDILLDELMGDVVYRYVKQELETADIPVVIASVLPPESSSKLLDMDPRTIYLQKPFTRRRLLEVIQGGA
jgi:CheY-like chemotaxis protein